MKKMINYISITVKSRPLGLLTACFINICTLLFAAGLYGTASFILSLAALKPTYDLMMIPVVSVRLFGLGRAVLSYAERYYSHNTTFHILKKLRLSLYDKMVPVLPDYRTRKGENLSKVISDVETLQEGILRFIYPLLSSVLLLVLGLFISYQFHPLLAIVFGSLFVVNNYLVPFFLYYCNSKKKQIIDRDKKALYMDLLELNEGIAEITSDSRETDWIRKIEYNLEKMNGKVDSYHRLAALSEALVVLLQGISFFAVILTASYLTYEGTLSGLYLAAATLTITTLLNESMLLLQAYSKFSVIQKAAENIFSDDKVAATPDEFSNCEVAATPDEFSDGKVAATHVETIDIQTKNINEKLTLKDITFRYPASRTIFHKFSMSLEKGKLVAVVGGSGCGKSTLINLILGFLQPEAGEIKVGEVNLLSIDEVTRMKYFSIVDQKPFFFNQTILENLKLSDPDVTEEEIYEVLKKVSLYDLINSSPEGLNTLVYEWGANLSGGELQRLAIARAMLKKAPFYIFDEPTAGLDTINEKRIMEIIFELAEENGVLLITHRPCMMDQIHTVIRL